MAVKCKILCENPQVYRSLSPKQREMSGGNAYVPISSTHCKRLYFYIAHLGFTKPSDKHDQFSHAIKPSAFGLVSAPAPFLLLCEERVWGIRLTARARSASWNAGAGVRMH